MCQAFQARGTVRGRSCNKLSQKVLEEQRTRAGETVRRARLTAAATEKGSWRAYALAISEGEHTLSS